MGKREINEDMAAKMQNQLNHLGSTQRLILDRINELSEILLQYLAEIKPQKGAASKKAVPGKRASMKQRKQELREHFTRLNK